MSSNVYIDTSKYSPSNESGTSGITQSAEEDALQKGERFQNDELEQKQIPTMDQERESIVEAEARWVRERGLDQPKIETQEEESFQDAKDELRHNLAENEISNEANSRQRDQQLNDESQQEKYKPERMYGDQQIEQSQIAKIEREKPSLTTISAQSLPLQSLKPDTSRTERDQEISSEQPSFDMVSNAMEQRTSHQSHNKQDESEIREGKSNPSIEEELHDKLRLKPSENLASKEKSLSMEKKNESQEEKRRPEELHSSIGKHRLEEKHYSHSRPDESYSSKQGECSSSSRKTAESAQTFEFEDLISYLNEHKAVIEEALTDEDKKRIKIILSLGRELKILYKDTIETIKADLVKYYEAFKSKMETTMQDLNKLQQTQQEMLQ